MLPLFRRSVGLALKIQLHNCNPAYQLHRRKPSQNPSARSKTTLVGSSFGSLTSSHPETSHQKQHLREIDHKFAMEY